jgi:uncharacterized SAM-binding protein YcdF (DUF218 family)
VIVLIMLLIFLLGIGAGLLAENLVRLLHRRSDIAATNIGTAAWIFTTSGMLLLFFWI